MLINLDKMLRKIASINNRKVLEEITWILSKLEAIHALLKGLKTRLNPRIQTAGDYDPFMTDEEMMFFFGKVIEKRRVWI